MRICVMAFHPAGVLSVRVSSLRTVTRCHDPEVSGDRVDSRGEQKSKFERLEFQRRVRDNYLRIAKERGFSVLDASKSPEDLCSEAMKLIDQRR